MKTHRRAADRKQRRSPRSVPDTGASEERSLYQRLTGSWAVNALVVPLLISLFSAIVTLLLTHWGR